MANETAGAIAPKENKEVEPPKVAPSKKEPSGRVIKKVDLNTVEVLFEGAKEGSQFHVLDGDVVRGTGIVQAGEGPQSVLLESYLPKGQVHNFRVELK